MISSTLLAASVPATPVWSPTVAIIIGASCAVALLFTLGNKSAKVGPTIPGLPIGAGAFIGAMAFGHILGVGIVLGLTNIGNL